MTPYTFLLIERRHVEKIELFKASPSSKKKLRDANMLYC